MEPFPDETSLQQGWEQLGVGAPTLIAFAALCGRSLLQPPVEDAALSTEAEALLAAAADRGVLEVKGINTAFSAPGRLLAVCVERAEDEWLVFRDTMDPEYTIRCLEGFRQLCQNGLMLHHLYRDFTLSSAGFARARQVDQDRVRSVLDRADTG